MKTYAEFLDATENAMLADFLISKNIGNSVAFIDGTGCRGAISLAMLADPKQGMIDAARAGGKKLQREIVKRGWLTQEEIDS